MWTEVASLEQLIEQARIVLCCGSGGVGKTTTAAVLAIHAARAGRRAVVVTIDPARRLADALGLGSDGLSNEPRQVEIPMSGPAGRQGGPQPRRKSAATGELWAMMLDTSSTFDAVVARYSSSPEQAASITANSFYRNISGALSGTQEYMAAEKLYELHHDERFDLVVVDTPPTRNALDFLDAPERLTRFLDHRVYRALTAPTRIGLKVIGAATQLFLKPIARVVGAEVITDVIGFFQAFDGMDAGFRARAATVVGLLRDPATQYVLVASPRRDAVAEAAFFAGKLADNGLAVSAIVVNRLHPLFAGSAPSASASTDAGSQTATRATAASPATAETAVTAGERSPRSNPARSAEASSETLSGVAESSSIWAFERAAPLPDGRERELWLNLAELRQVAERERATLGPLIDQVGDVPLVEVPLLTEDVHDLVGLIAIEGYLFASSRGAG